jgi:hypothetical protein
VAAAEIKVAADREIVWQGGERVPPRSRSPPTFRFGQLGDGSAAQIEAAADVFGRHERAAVLVLL